MPRPSELSEGLLRRSTVHERMCESDAPWRVFTISYQRDIPRCTTETNLRRTAQVPFKSKTHDLFPTIQGRRSARCSPLNRRS